jgi:hypothetical protein
MPLDERVRLRIKLEAQKILRSKMDVIDDRLEKLELEYKRSKGERKEATELLISLIEEGLDTRELNINDQ